MAAEKLEKRITFRLDSSRFDHLEQLAAAEGFSVALIVRHLVYRFVEERRRTMRTEP